jgi:hypothetical protein
MHVKAGSREYKPKLGSHRFQRIRRGEEKDLPLSRVYGLLEARPVVLVTTAHKRHDHR